MENMSSRNENYMAVIENSYNQYNGESLEPANTKPDDKAYFEVYSLLNRTSYDTSASYSINSTSTSLDYEYCDSNLAFNNNPNQWNREEIWQNTGNSLNDVYPGNFPLECPSMLHSQIENDEQQASDQEALASVPPFISYSDTTRKNTCLPRDPLTSYKLLTEDEQSHVQSVTRLTRSSDEKIDDHILGSSTPPGSNQDRKENFNYLPPLLNQWVISNPSYLHSDLLNDGECYPTSRTEMQDPGENMLEKWISYPVPSSMNSKQKEEEEANLAVAPLTDPENRNVLSLSPETLLANLDASPSDAEDRNLSSPVDCMRSPPLNTRSEQSSHDPFPSRTLRPTSPERSRDPFHIAHRDSFGVSPDRSERLQNSSRKVTRICQPDSCDDEGDTSWSDTDSSCSSFVSTNEENVSDDADRSIEETISTIHKPQLIPCEVSTPENLHTFLSPHEVGHINYLVKCYSDAIFSISIPSTSIGVGKILSPISYLNLHMFGVLQVYYLMFKCEDYRNLSSNHQLCLLERNMIPVLISLGFMFFDGDDKCWRIPLVLVNKTSTLPLGSLLKFLPEKAVRNLIALCDASKELRVDKIMCLLFVFIIIYTPVDKQIETNKLMDKLREKYVRILLQYLRWKFGSINGAMLFPEILKILDALLKFNEEINDYKLRLNEEEIAMLTHYFKYIEQQTGSLLLRNYDETENIFGDEISYASFHAKLSSLLLPLGSD